MLLTTIPSPRRIPTSLLSLMDADAAHGLARHIDAAIAEEPDLAERLTKIADSVPGRLAFSSSLGMEDQAITHAIAIGGRPFDIFTLDTGRHFPETLETLYKTANRYHLNIRVLYPESSDVEQLVADDGIYGFRNSIECRKACCEVRKVRPLNKALKGASAWITGVRREQSFGRSQVPFASFYSALGLIKINPLADWDLAKLERYIRDNGIPINPLHGHGYPSIGCQPCTRALAPDEDGRAGRWWWETESTKECGLHNHPNRPNARDEAA